MKSKVKPERKKRGGSSRAARCSAHVDRLYKAVQNYVEKGGGKLVVIGGISVQEWPTDNPMVFHIAVKCCGRKPTFVGPNDQALRLRGTTEDNKVSEPSDNLNAPAENCASSSQQRVVQPTRPWTHEQESEEMLRTTSRPEIRACVGCGENAPEHGLICDECRYENSLL